jgi:DnaJ-class molecular chaperone
MSYGGSNLCNQLATKLPTCELCKGEGIVYPLVEKTCPLCEGKKSICAECGGCGYVRIIEPTKCEDCLGTGRIVHIAMARG